MVNRLLFPYLFEAVGLMERDRPGARGDRHVHARWAPGTRWARCALLDLVGLDVSAAIGETIGADVPERLRRR